LGAIFLQRNYVIIYIMFQQNNFIYIFIKKLFTNKNNTAFTLVELLIVIAIIGILSTAAVINLRGAKDKAFDSQVFGTLAQLRSAVVGCIYEDQPLICGTNGTHTCDGNLAPSPVAGLGYATVLILRG